MAWRNAVLSVLGRSPSGVSDLICQNLLYHKAHSAYCTHVLVYQLKPMIWNLERVYFLFRCVIVIEKDSIFQRLVQEGFPATTESILITAKGMPDHATRCFVAKLATQFPGLPIFGGLCFCPVELTWLWVCKSDCWKFDTTNTALK